MKEYDLKVAQNGFAAGTAFLPATGTKTEVPEVQNPEAELARFRTAEAALERELSEAAAKADRDTASIFEAERSLLEDPAFADTVSRLIEQDGMSAEAASEKAGETLSEEIQNDGSKSIRQRSGDMSGLTKRLLALLQGEEKHIPQTPFILAAEELSPAQLAALDPALILGIVTAKGSPTSHVSIIAGNLGIPYFYGSEEAVAGIREDTRLILDQGKLTADPDEKTYRAAIQAMEVAKKEKKTAPAGSSRTKVLANITGPQDIPALLDAGADGVGLFRTELLFLNNPEAPTEEEQYQAYRSVAEAMAGKETVIRTMDLGSDKQSAWLHLPEEENPALGCRGLRVSLQEEALFKTQLRAILRASVHGDVRVMVPMVTSCWEVDAVRAKMEACAQELAAEKQPYKMPPLGIMVETPSAAVLADHLAEKAAFFSIGTNDLTQYTLALDRDARGLEQYDDPNHEAVLRLIGMTAEAGHQRKIPTAVCGELAADPAVIKKLIERGVDELSVSVSKIAATRACVLSAEQQLSQKSGSPQPEARTLSAPADGKLIPMKDIPDPAFSSGTLGDCVGILPENGKIYAPCDGTVLSVAETKHAVTLQATDGRKVLIHAGIDTVRLGGKGFTVHVRENDAVKTGDLILEADLDAIRNAGLSPMVITALCP